jgi:hypothetical protein
MFAFEIWLEEIPDICIETLFDAIEFIFESFALLLLLLV